MANTITFQEKPLSIGDVVAVEYKIKEGEKFRIQEFKGTLLKIGGSSDATRTITVRKMSKAGIGIERIFPLSSPFISEIKLSKKSNYSKAKLYFIRDLSEKAIRRKLYRGQQNVTA